MKQYSAKLLFQWRPVRDGVSRKRRICEQRIVTFTAETANAALTKAKETGKSEEYIEEKTDGEVHFEFIGVLELLDVTLGFSDGEVWSELKEMVEPMERMKELLPCESELDALRESSPSKQGRLKYGWPEKR